MWRVLFDCIKHDDVAKGLCFRKVFILNPSALFCANPVISSVELICLALRCLLLSCMLVVLGREAWKALTLDNALREPAGRWESEGIGFMLAKDYRKAQKRRRGSSGEDVKDEGRVLHHLCWADDLYAMAGTMNHLTRILEDMINAVERLGMRWKEKGLTIVAGPFTEYKPGDVVEIISNSGTRWIWRVVEGMEALGTWLDNRGCSEASMWHRISKANSMFHAKTALFCDPKLPVKMAY